MSSSESSSDWTDSSSDDELAMLPVIIAAFDDSESEDDEPRVSRGGSVPGKKRNLDRSHLECHEKLWNNYFSENPRYDERTFRRRFRMSSRLSRRIHDAVKLHDIYFMQKRDAIGRLGLSSYQKITASIRMLAYAMPADILDDVMGMAEYTILESFARFCKAVIAVFGDEYLRSPTEDDVERILKQNSNRGFPGMLGSISNT